MVVAVHVHRTWICIGCYGHLSILGGSLSFLGGGGGGLRDLGVGLRDLNVGLSDLAGGRGGSSLSILS